MVTAGLISLVSALLKIRAVRRQPDAPGPKAMCLGLLAFGTAFLVLAPPHTVLISELLRVPNSGRLLGNLLTLASAGAMQVMMLHLVHPPPVARQRVRRRLIVVTLVALAMTVLLTSAHTENVTNFVERYATSTPIGIYQLLYLSCLAMAVVDLIHLSIRYSRHVAPMLRTGLRMVATGGVVYALHTAYKMALITSAWLGRRLPGDESTIATTLAALGGILIAGGTTLPVWGPRALAPWRLLRQYRSYRRLAPLWRELSDAVPEVMLSQPEAVAEPAPWTMDIRLYRRVIEIRDAQLLLQPYSDPEAVDAAQEDARRGGLRGERVQAHVDAVALVTGLRRWRSEGPGAPPAVLPRRSVGDASLARESRYLEQVAAAFSRVDASRSGAGVSR
ncbi:hypothetical protein Xph01_48420 [Micromonospora phaseoli]|nr:hypothetical protein Xph01_48420 [Micromonospora phaseoli]